MSMTLLTMKQLIEIFILYTALTVMLPALIFHKVISGLRLCIRIMIYAVVGNFYLINLVLFLQLLHISNRYTLVFFTLILSIFLAITVNRIPIKSIITQKYEYFSKLMLGRMGIRSFLRAFVKGCRNKIVKFSLWIWSRIHNHILEWILVILFAIYLFWIYGTNSFFAYGYETSDMPVHNYWINEMSKNNIFAAGVYPFGFHCIIYFIHTVFGIDTYVLLRLFCLIQTAYIHLMLFAFIKATCKTRFAPFIGIGSYITLQIFNADAFMRFYSSLPQEFGMIFIFPSIYFALAFFQEKKLEISAEWIISKDKKRRIKAERKKYLRSLKFIDRMRAKLKAIPLSYLYLIFYSLSFSLTLAAHFYGTIIAGLFCVAIAIAFVSRFFRRGYFVQVIAAFLAGMIIAILPMAIAFSTGTKLEGSLGWGLNVIKGKDATQIETQNDTQIEDVNQLQNQIQTPGQEGGTISSGETANDQLEITSGEIVGENITDIEITPQSEDSVITLGTWLQTKIKLIPEKTVTVSNSIYYSINYLMKVVGRDDNNLFPITLICMAGLVGFAFISMILRRYDYAATLMASIIYIGFLFLLLGSKSLGLPELMDNNRTRIYLSYSLPIIWSFVADAPIYTLFGGFKKKWVKYCASLIVCVTIGFFLSKNVPYRTPMTAAGLQTNEAVTCLTNIIHENDDFTWTIVSVTDELNMGIDHGFHYEAIDFLRKMEYTGAYGALTIPTSHVYFFIEKVPIDYMSPYEKSGQSISTVGARKTLPIGNNISVYQGENRWIVMSKMYYWAQAYQKMYSNEMKVYFENDYMICYQIKQNEYSLNNFAIDYGYNLPENTEK